MSYEIRKITPDEYPIQLRQIARLPKSMDIIGAMPGPENKFLCVVGSRSHDQYGLDACKLLIDGLKGYPVVIVSGLAIGIDSYAHDCAINAGLKTISFPGSGLSQGALYPSLSRNLARRIVDSGGALISPFDLHQRGDKWMFPVRNVLMAAISHVTLVIQGGKKSGTLLTATNALDFGRTVLAVPGSIFSSLSYGTHHLLERGAAPATSSADILRALDFKVDDEFTKSNIDITSLPDDEKIIVARLQFSPMTGNKLIEATGLPASVFNSLASILELKGLITEDGGIYRMNL